MFYFRTYFYNRYASASHSISMSIDQVYLLFEYIFNIPFYFMLDHEWASLDAADSDPLGQR